MSWLGRIALRFRLAAGDDLEALAKDCEARGETGLAIAAVRKILDRNSGYVLGWIKLSRLYESLSDTETAFSAAGAAVAAARRPGGTAPLEIAALRRRASLGIKQGKLEESEKDLRAAFRLAKQNGIKAAMTASLEGLAEIAEARGDAAMAAVYRDPIQGQAAAAPE